MVTAEQISAAILASSRDHSFEVNLEAVIRKLPSLRLVSAEISASGYFVPDGVLDEYAYIVVNARDALERKRFTIAHELGHYLYRKERILNCSEELWCDQFAAHILMPTVRMRKFARDVTGLLKWLEGPSKFRVSKEAFFRRAWETASVATFEVLDDNIRLSRPAAVDQQLLDAIKVIGRRGQMGVDVRYAKIHIVSVDLFGRKHGILQYTKP